MKIKFSPKNSLWIVLISKENLSEYQPSIKEESRYLIQDLILTKVRWENCVSFFDYIHIYVYFAISYSKSEFMKNAFENFISIVWFILLLQAVFD